MLHPPRVALGEDGLEVVFEEGAGVLEVLLALALAVARPSNGSTSMKKAPPPRIHLL
jgi:hypothetical protein